MAELSHPERNIEEELGNAKSTYQVRSPDLPQKMYLIIRITS